MYGCMDVWMDEFVCTRAGMKGCKKLATPRKFLLYNTCSSTFYSTMRHVSQFEIFGYVYEDIASRKSW